MAVSSLTPTKGNQSLLEATSDTPSNTPERFCGHRPGMSLHSVSDLLVGVALRTASVAFGPLRLLARLRRRPTLLLLVVLLIRLRTALRLLTALLVCVVAARLIGISTLILRTHADYPLGLIWIMSAGGASQLRHG